MAVIYTEIFSQSLMRTVPFCALIPVEAGAPDAAGKSPSPPAESPFKTLYLLHGLYGSHTDWLTLTAIRRYAAEKRIAVIMPAGENSFYRDGTLPGRRYGSFIGEELVTLTRRLFPLSPKQADTVIAGLSMGGAGAVHTACLYPHTFSAAAGLSSAFLRAAHLSNSHPVFTPKWAQHIFGSTESMEAAYKHTVQSLTASADTVPYLYLECGTEDFLLDANRDFVRFLNGLGIPHEYGERNGGHDWLFWDIGIKKIIDRFF